MKRLLLVLMLVAAAAYAADSVNPGKKVANPLGLITNGWSPLDSTSYPQKIDASGNGYVQFGSPMQDQVILYANAINDTITPMDSPAMTAAKDNPSGMLYGADSSATLDVHSLKTISIGIKAWPSGDTLVAPDTLGVMLIAVEIRGHILQSQDSSVTYIWNRMTPQSPSAAVFPAAVDTAGRSGAVATSYSAAMNGEFVVAYPMFGVAALGATGRIYNPNLGMCFNLSTAGGQQFNFPYMSIRVRCLSTGITGKGSRSVFHKPRIKVDVWGKP